ncbi:MAG: single-stranded-DNA-specific exonuclease RecJ [Lachnospiraceae bacterium]|nr:single-stranded-DNA-specific exonuclease RecJ [Lachnospiraceae bacterium]
MQKENWRIRAKKADFYEIGRKYNISPIIARIIRNRDIVGDDNIDFYLNGTLEKMYSPWLFKDMDKAVDILSIKIKQNNKIRIICDYDIDGICSGYILLDAFRFLGADADVVVPHRIEDGYGINENLIERAFEEGVDTIVTCDNGIAACKAIDFAKSKGMTIIVTDHHEVPFEMAGNEKKYIIPNADAVIDHKQSDCDYPCKELCGAMVALKFIEALYDSMGISTNVVKKYLQFGAIATIGDVVPLVDENRVIVKYGLQELRHTENIGINALIKECNIKKDIISSHHIGFIIGPCLNASGRLDTAKKAINLLMSTDNNKAEIIAKELKKLNDERKNLTDLAVDKANIIAKNMEDKVLVVYLEDCHESIAGIVAGRIRELYNKPTIVLTKTENGVKGSGRSIEAYNMFEELTKVKDILPKFGGHKMAAGVSLTEENVDVLRKRLNEQCTLTDEDLIPVVWIDTELPVEYISFDLIEQLSVIEPFGMGNEKPVFAARNLKVLSMNLLGKEGNVLKFNIESESGNRIEGISFNKAQNFINFINEKFGNEELKKAMRGMTNNIVLNAVYYPSINEYNGSKKLQMVISNLG